MDTSIEPERRDQISDVLWRSIKGRGGRRGYSQKVRHIKEGLQNGAYSLTYPFVTQEGRLYAQLWQFRILDSVSQGASVWEIGSSSESESEAGVISSSEPVIPRARAEVGDNHFGRLNRSAASSSTSRPVAEVVEIVSIFTFIGASFG